MVLVDDQSSDGTAQLAEAAAAGIGAADRLTVITGRTPPAGWTGKLWALKQGIERVGGARRADLCAADRCRHCLWPW